MNKIRVFFLKVFDRFSKEVYFTMSFNIEFFLRFFDYCFWRDSEGFHFSKVIHLKSLKALEKK